MRKDQMKKKTSEKELHAQIWPASAWASINHPAKTLLKRPSGRCLRLQAALLILISSLGQGATYTVSNAADSGPGSLRQPILDANANPSGVDPVCTHTRTKAAH
jgi:hypothetical protein